MIGDVLNYARSDSSKSAQRSQEQKKNNKLKKATDENKKETQDPKDMAGLFRQSNDTAMDYYQKFKVGKFQQTNYKLGLVYKKCIQFIDKCITDTKEKQERMDAIKKMFQVMQEKYRLNQIKKISDNEKQKNKHLEQTSHITKDLNNWLQSRIQKKNTLNIQYRIYKSQFTFKEKILNGDQKKPRSKFDKNQQEQYPQQNQKIKDLQEKLFVTQKKLNLCMDNHEQDQQLTIQFIQLHNKRLQDLFKQQQLKYQFKKQEIPPKENSVKKSGTQSLKVK